MSAKKIDKRTGREVITNIKHPTIKPRAGYVLREVYPPRKVSTGNEVIIGGDMFEWVPAAEVKVVTEESPDMTDGR